MKHGVTPPKAKSTVPPVSETAGSKYGSSGYAAAEDVAQAEIDIDNSAIWEVLMRLA